MADTIWTEEDLQTLKAAVASGVLTVRYSGPPSREVTYQSLAEMRRLLQSMVSQVRGSRRVGLAGFRKGYCR